MPVRLQLAIREGWKAQKNERFGEAMEVRFINTENDEIMFRYAPKCEDKQVWEYIFSTLEKYDKALIDLRGIVRMVDEQTFKSGG